MEPSNKLLERAIEVQLEEKIKNFDFDDWVFIKCEENSNLQRDNRYKTSVKGYVFYLFERKWVSGGDIGTGIEHNYSILISRGEEDIYDSGYSMYGTWRRYYEFINNQFMERERKISEEIGSKKKLLEGRLRSEREERFLKDLETD